MRLSGSGFDDRVDWLVGAYLYNDDKDEIFLRVPILIELLGSTLGLQSDSKLETDSYALFANFNMTLSERLSGFVGARYTSEDKDILLSDSLTAPTLGLIDESLSTSKTTWRAGVEYRPREDMMFYATYATGFKSAQFDNSAGAIFSLNAEPVGEETVQSFEAGLKANWLEGRLVTNVALFNSQYEDFQALALLPGQVSSSLISAGEVDIYGAELEAIFRPTEYLYMSLGLGLLRTE